MRNRMLIKCDRKAYGTFTRFDLPFEPQQQIYMTFRSKTIGRFRK